MAARTSLEHSLAMTRQPAEPLRLDRPIRAGAVHSMTGETYRSVGLRGPKIVAVSTEAGGLDDLASTGTIATDAPDLTLLPAFSDSHEHMMEASRNTLLVPVDRARSVAEFLAMVRDAARAAQRPRAGVSWNSPPGPKELTHPGLTGQVVSELMQCMTRLDFCRLQRHAGRRHGTGA